MTSVPLLNSEAAWKSTILKSLRQRNYREVETFKSIFSAYVKLFDLSESLKLQQRQAEVNAGVEKFKQQVYNDPKAQDKLVTALEHKIYHLQRELTDVHRLKGDNVQQLMDLRYQLQEKEKIILEKEQKIQDQDSMIYGVKQALRQAETTVLNFERANQLLKDEQHALHTAYASLEQNSRKLKQEYQEMATRREKLKAVEVTQKDAEVERFVQRRKDSMLEDILRAVKQHVEVKTGPYDDWVSCSVPGYGVGAPSIVQHKFDAHESEVNAIRWSPIGRYFATGGADRQVKVWEGVFSQPIVFTGPSRAVTSVDFDPGELTVMAATCDPAIYIWAINDRRLKHKLTGHEGKISSSKFMAGPNLVMSGSHDRMLKLWDLRNGACTQNFFPGSICNDLVTYGDWSVISGHFDGKVRFWDTRTTKCLKELEVGGRVTSLDLSSSHEGLRLLSCSRDNSLKVIDVDKSEIILTLRADNFNVARDWSRAGFSSDGQYAAAGSANGVLYMWNLKSSAQENGRLARVLKEHASPIAACSWHPLGNQLLSCDCNQQVVAWL